MNKIHLLAFIFIASFLNLKAQEFRSGTYGQTDQFASDLFRQMRVKDSRASQKGAIKGSPYFEEEFVKGQLFYNGKPQDQTVFLRYNAFSDEIEMTPNQYQYKTDQAIIKSSDISCFIGIDKFVYLPYEDKTSEVVKMGYLIEKHKGKKYNLYFNKSKVYMEATYARTGLERSFPARFVDDETYYYNVNGDTPKELKLYKSNIKEAFEDKARINNFLKTHKRSKDNTDQWLVELFMYMEQ